MTRATSSTHQDAEGFVRLWGLGIQTWSARQGSRTEESARQGSRTGDSARQGSRTEESARQGSRTGDSHSGAD